MYTETKKTINVNNMLMKYPDIWKCNATSQGSFYRDKSLSLALNNSRSVKSRIAALFVPRSWDLQEVSGSTTQGYAVLVKAYYLTQIKRSQAISCTKNKQQELELNSDLQGASGGNTGPG